MKKLLLASLFITAFSAQLSSMPMVYSLYIYYVDDNGGLILAEIRPKDP